MGGLLGGIVPMLENIFPIAGAITGGGDAPKREQADGLLGGLTGLLGTFLDIFQLAGGPDFIKGNIAGTQNAMTGMDFGALMGSATSAMGAMSGGGDAGGIGAMLGAMGGA